MEKGREPEEVRQQKRARQTGSRGGGAKDWLCKSKNFLRRILGKRAASPGFHLLPFMVKQWRGIWCSSEARAGRGLSQTHSQRDSRGLRSRERACVGHRGPLRRWHGVRWHSESQDSWEQYTERLNRSRTQTAVWVDVILLLRIM